MRTISKFYLSCLLSSWGDRLWYFALSIYFITINKDTLLITAINGFTCNLVGIFLGANIGSIIDKYQRLNVVRLSLFIQNTTVAINCIIVLNILVFKEFTQTAWNGVFLYFCQGIMIFLNVISNLSSMATKISIERDWVIVIAKHIHLSQEGDESQEDTAKYKEKLAGINATVRRIDLTTAVIAPLVAGSIMSLFQLTPSFNGTVMSALFFSIWNFVSYIFEYNLLIRVYNEVPNLKKKSVKIDKKPNVYCKPFFNLIDGWSVYMKQGLVILPSLALSVLYLTTLTFDGITIGYAKSQKLTELTISIFQAIGSISGVLGTIVFQYFHNKLKIFLPVIGLIGSVYQLTFLFICLASIWLPGSPFVLAIKFFSTKNECDFKNITLISDNFTEISKGKTFISSFVEPSCNSYISILVLLGALAVSRLGLWLMDLVINQIVQENVAENERGVVGGVQGSVNKIFDMIKYICVISMPGLATYGFLVIISVSAVFVAFCLYSAYCIKALSRRYIKVPVKEASAQPLSAENDDLNEEVEFQSINGMKKNDKEKNNA